ncbi:MAG: presenilin family intramembrane aspartyl protease [archaeon]|jgi:presenilin-like A22 family membrane protease
MPKRVLKKAKEKAEWLSTEVLVKLALMFFAVQTLGLYVAQQLFLMGLAQPQYGLEINNVGNAFYLFGSILVMTAVILILLKFRRTKKALWFLEAMAIFSTCIIVLSVFFPTNDYIVLGVTALILLWRYTHLQSILFRDFVSLIAVSGAGAYIGISFGLVPILAFIIILAIYDIIAVFYTKHMVTIGKEATSNNYAFTVAIPTKEHKFELGNGDLVIPLAVASSVLVNGSFVNNGLIAGLCLGVSFIGLATSIYMVSKKKIPMPALPPQTLLMIIVIVGALLLGL